MNDVARRIAENLARVRDRIPSAAARSGRDASAVTLVAVTKGVPVEWIQALVDAGCKDLGESRPQELWDKAAALAESSCRWHLIGHLQRNKVRRTLPLVELIHSVDSLRLLKAIQDEASAGEHFAAPVRVLLEVNVTSDTSKTGLAAEEVEPVLLAAGGFDRVRIEGLMGMASLEGGEAAARRDFKALRELRDRLQTVAPAEVQLRELSMGMSGDFEVAIEEGATIVRVGSALFEGLTP